MTTIADAPRRYEEFRRQQESLRELVQETRGATAALDAGVDQSALRRIEERVAADTFKVLVIGEFKRGKSTFINALLGAEVLPAYEVPCTALINEVKWGEQPRAVLHLRQPDADGRRTREIPLSQIVEYTTIKDFARKEMEVKQSPYEKIDLFWPMELCRNGVEIIDSPGLNESETRERVTVDYVKDADATLFVMSAEALGPSISEDRAIEMLKAAGHEDIFFIINRFDLIRESGKEMVRRHGLAQFATRTKHGASRIFFLSAFQALEGRLKGVPELLEASAVLPLERALEEFLTTERGKLKLLGGAGALHGALRDVQRRIPEQEELLETDAEKLQERYATVQEPLRQLELDRRQIVARVGVVRADAIQRVTATAETFYRSAAGKVEEWVAAYEISTPVGLRDLVFSRDQTAEAVFEEVATHVKEQVQGAALEWQKTDLEPVLTEIFDRLRADLDDRLERFLGDVDSVREHLTPNAAALSGVEPNVERPGALDRLLAATGGFLLGGDVGLAAMGAMGGYREILRGIIPYLAAQLAVIALFGFNPIALLGVMIASMWWRGLRTGERVKEKIKEGIITEYSRYLREQAGAEARKVGDKVSEKLGEIQRAVDDAMGKQLETVRKQVETALKEKAAGEAEVKRRLLKLRDVRGRLDTIGGQLNDFLAQVAHL